MVHIHSFTGFFESRDSIGKKFKFDDEDLPNEEMKEVMSRFSSAEELLRKGGFSTDVLDRAAFGFSEEDMTEMSPKDIRIRWTDDRENAEYQMERSGKGPRGWARSVDLSEPVDVSYRSVDGKEPDFYLEDGHHRHLAASILGKKLNVNLEIVYSPEHVLYPDTGYDEFTREMFRRYEKTKLNESVMNGEKIDRILYHSSDSIFKKFDRRKITGDRGSYYGPGFYFSDNKEYTRQFGRYLYECEVRMKRPFDLTRGDVGGLLRRLISSYEFTKVESESFDYLLSGKNYMTLFNRILRIVGEGHLKKMGYDGIIGWCEEGGREYVVWEPEQVEILNGPDGVVNV